MKKILAVVSMLLGLIFQGATSPSEEARPTKESDERSTSELKKAPQTEQEKKMIKARLKGLGYFQ